MPNTLFLIEDEGTKKLGAAIMDPMKAEVTAIYGFVPRFKVVTVLADNLPAILDFTDSVVKIVAHDDDVSDAMNAIKNAETRSMTASIQSRGIRVTPSTPVAGSTDAGGVGWNAKSIITASNGVKIAVTQTGGVVSIEFVADTALTQAAPNSETLEEATSRRDRALAHARVNNNDAGEKAAALQAFDKAKSHFALSRVGPQDWPKDLQTVFAIGLGRAIAHEARHQYINEHSSKGLGEEAAPIYEKADATFSTDDQKDITDALKRLDTLQKTASFTAQTIASDQPSGFK